MSDVTVFPTPRQRGIRELTHLDEDLDGLSRPESFILGYEAGWKAACDLCIQLENLMNEESEEENHGD